MGRNSVQLLVLLTFMVAVTNCAGPSTSTTKPTILDKPVTLPPPDPSVTEFNYYVRDPETGVACILANMTISMTVTYVSTSRTPYNKTTVLIVPPTAEVKGTCSGTTPTMELIWAQDPTLKETQNGITFVFGSTRNISFLQDIVYDLYMDYKSFPGANDEGKKFGGILRNVYKFAASKNGLYKCALETTMGSVDVDITITNVALIAFNTEKSVATKTEEHCEPDNELTPAPLPQPDPSVTKFNYYVRDPETGVACILANMSISIQANYISVDDAFMTALLKIPPTAKVRGTCNGAVPTMELIWAEDPTLAGALNGIALMFNSTNTTFFLQDIVLQLYIDGKNFPYALREGNRREYSLKNVNKFTTSKNGLHKCALETTVGDSILDITITDVALIAFNTEKSVATKTEENCESDNNELTPAPLPQPDPSVTKFNYYVRDRETGVACILANMSISINASYISTGYRFMTALLKIPPTAEVRGKCNGAVPTMELIWAEDPTLEGTQNGIAFMFNSTNTTFFLQEIVLELYIDSKTFPNANKEGQRFGTKLGKINKFSASKNGGFYRCESGTTVRNGAFEITITDVTLIAFNTEQIVAAKTEENCVADPGANGGADGGATGEANVGAIVGGVIGGVALIAIIVIVIVVLRKKCR